MERRIYIWQQPDWPHFKWSSEELLKPLAQLSQHHGELNGRMTQLGIRTQQHSTMEALTEELIKSSEIEGITLNPQSVRSSIARKLGIEDDGLLAEDHYIEGLVDVMLDAINNCNEEITEDRIFNWHGALFPTGRSGMYKITVADWRQGDAPMQVVSGAFGKEKVHYEAPPSEKIATEMKSFLEWCNSTTLSPFIVSAIAHLWFVTIHPFDDGNGRIARTLSDLFLARADNSHMRYYSMSAEINRNKKAYYNILERTQKGDLELTEWIQWYIEHLEKAIARVMSAIDRTLGKSQFWERFENMEINERQRKVLNRLMDGFDGKLTTSKWAKICHCSQDTALRDIKDLISKGMLTQGNGAGRSMNYLAAGVQARRK